MGWRAEFFGKYFSALRHRTSRSFNSICLCYANAQTLNVIHTFCSGIVNDHNFCYTFATSDNNMFSPFIDFFYTLDQSRARRANYYITPTHQLPLTPHTLDGNFDCFFLLSFLGPTLYFVESHLVEFLIAQRATLLLDYGFGDFSHFYSTLEANLKF
jgi:hypothetical protein